MPETSLQLILVEDDRVDAQATERALNRLNHPSGPAEGVTLHLANQAEAARNHLLRLLAQGHKRIVILLDVDLPDESGISLAQELTNHPAHPIVVLLTSSPAPCDIADAWGAGIHGYLLKPDSPAALAELLGTVCRYWRANRFRG